MKNLLHTVKTKTSGFIVAYILFGISLLSVVVATLSLIGSQQTDATVTANRRSEIISDAQSIRMALTHCALLFPAGNNGDPNAGSAQYPATGDGLAANLLCPGHPSGQTTIWQALTQAGGSSLPVPPQRRGMTPWRYFNGRDADNRPDVFFYLEPLSPDDQGSNALLKSVTASRSLNPDPSLEAKSLAVRAETISRPDGTSVIRLRSRNLADTAR